MAPFLISSWCTLLIACDLRWRRLPDQLTLPGALILALWVVGEGHPEVLWGGFAWSTLYLLTAVTHGGVGGGDIKFALGLGIIAALGGIGSWLLAVLGASVFSLLLAFGMWLRLLLSGLIRGAPGTAWRARAPVPAVPHGPGMVAGTAGAFLLHTLAEQGRGWVM